MKRKATKQMKFKRQNANRTLNTFGSMNPTFSGTFYFTCMKMAFMDLKRFFLKETHILSWHCLMSDV